MSNGVLIALYITSFVLPTLGFVRLLQRAAKGLAAAERKVAERGSVHGNYNDLTEAAGADIRAAPRKAVADLQWDLGLVGVGLLAGAVAGIASLYV